MGLDRKTSLVRRLGAQVVVIPECARSNRLAAEPGVSAAWAGRLEHKGLGVFGLDGWTVSSLALESRRPWSLPVQISSPSGQTDFTLVAIWTIGSDRSGGLSYAEQIGQVIDEWESSLRDERVIVAGDFNCSAQTKDPAAHLRNIARLDALGVRSAYHAARDVPPGEEEDMTLRWVGRGRRELWFHCDFIFLSGRIAQHLDDAWVGAASEWIGPGLSDHAPVVAEWSGSTPARLRVR